MFRASAADLHLTNKIYLFLRIFKQFFVKSADTFFIGGRFTDFFNVMDCFSAGHVIYYAKLFVEILNDK